MKINPLFLIIALSFSTLSVNAQDYAVSKIPTALKENAHTVVRRSHTEFIVHSPGRATEKQHQVFTIFNDQSYYDELEVYYNQFTSIKSIEAKVYDQFGNLQQKAKKSDFKDYSAVSGFSLFDDSRARAVNVSSNRYPYTVEFNYTIEHNGIQAYPDWFPQEAFEVGVEQASFEINLPTDMEVRYKAKNTEATPEITEDKDRKRYSWEINNLGAIEFEGYSPAPQEYFPHVKCGPVNFEVAGYKGDMSNWNTLGQFFYELNKGRGVLSNELKQTIQKLTAGVESPEEKISILYDYLQENTRYVSLQLGIGGWQTFPASYVEKNKYGDCKALTHFMKAMLKEAEIEAYPALIQNGNRPIAIKEDFAHPSFNHVILYVPSEEPIWLECTSTYNPVNEIGFTNENRKVLLVKPGASQLIDTPASKAENNVESTKFTVNLSETGAAEVTYQEESTGRFQQGLRYNYKTKSEDDMEEYLISFFPFSGFHINEFTVNLHENKPQTDLDISLKIDKYASVSGKRIFFKTNLLRGIEVPKKLEKRQTPIQYNYAGIYKTEAVFNIPKGYRLENKKDRLEIDNEFGHYTAEVVVSGNQITYKRHLEKRSINLPAERYEDFRNFYLKVAKADKMKLALVKE